VDQLFEKVHRKYGRIDILINNAGVTRDRSLEKMSEAEWDTVIEVNLKGVFLCAQAVMPYMKAQKYGRIVSAASNVGLRGNFGQTNYAATKAGVIGMTKTWAIELGRYGITANAIAPGFTLTEMTQKIPDEHLAGIKAGIPLGTVAEPVDIAYGYLYLASDEARFVSGICLTIDGGASR
jgi:3-oxoacyl-[acyl-carrier protein] reductase